MKVAAEQPTALKSKSDLKAKQNPKTELDPEIRSWQRESVNSAAEGLLPD